MTAMLLGIGSELSQNPKHTLPGPSRPYQASKAQLRSKPTRSESETMTSAPTLPAATWISGSSPTLPGARGGGGGGKWGEGACAVSLARGFPFLGVQKDSA